MTTTDRLRIERLQAQRDLYREQRDLLRDALERLLEESCPFVCDAGSCECGEHGTGFDEAGNPCEHIQAARALEATKGL